ncbi:DUF4253 domain-containing protein [Porphyrobacter sp. ULC335]|uniref:DUF4253 domain-containing protein n=1 Tax=Porphyrobacter sp. ULC335 TaxID=2854260 RepID=UPI00221EA331|nr:DUF4253 domain-containing protein [Porphyrobacter sp. ULC335]UYV15331.1 DUF4253 domain-containing protein [Porphyrobacter sp. ULC335]
MIKGLLASLAGLFGAGRGTAQTSVPKIIVPRITTLSSDHARVKAMPGYRIEAVEGARALARWEELRAGGEGYPVIVGDAEALNALLEQVGDHDSPDIADTLAKAAALDWSQALNELKCRTREALAEFSASGEIEDAPEPEVGLWPARPDVASMPSTPFNVLTGAPYDVCYILVVPARHGWEVPAYTSWGAWNECPPPELHIAALRSWHERYGAELVGMSADVLDVRVTRRPASREEALALAREHFDYCPDIVYQGTETLAPLAASYMVSDWWYFWWD